MLARRGERPLILWDRVVQARADFALHRNLPASQSKSIARAELLTALEAYAAYLIDHRRPIPYLLRDELQIRRLTRHE
ncbi:MAG: hypothetical protein JWR90_1298 [Marmoricola sp.]|nr:hypothetical protein [Marmoricola sp.]